MIETGTIVTTLAKDTQSFYKAQIYYGGDLSGISSCVSKVDKKTRWKYLLMSFWSVEYKIEVYCHPERKIELLTKLGKFGIVGETHIVNRGYVKISALLSGLDMTTLILSS